MKPRGLVWIVLLLGVLGVIAACDAKKSTSGPELEPAPIEDIDVAPEPGPPATHETTKPHKTFRIRWDPPTDMPHLESTDPALRRKIDGLVATMMSVNEGRGAFRARDELAALGKPAFPRVLAAMAQIRDTITDDDNAEERSLESSLHRADECLREMDGYLTFIGKPPIRPGTDQKYIVNIIRLHYRRWTETLQHMNELPGSYDFEEWDPEKIEKIKSQLKRFHEGTETASSTLRALFRADDDMMFVVQRRFWPLAEAIPERLKKERASRRELAPLLVRELNHDNIRLRTLARDCLRALYDKTVLYNTRAPPARREEKVRRWREVIDAADR